MGKSSIVRFHSKNPLNDLQAKTPQPATNNRLDTTQEKGNIVAIAITM